MKSSQEIIQKLFSFTETIKGCWVWKNKIKERYPALKYLGKQTRAHRISYLVFYGQIPEGKSVLHKCDNTHCINPKHLFLGTQKDNMQDMKLKGRSAVGEKHGNHKLSEKDVIRIRSLANKGHSQSFIANLFNVSREGIGRVIRRETWRHI